MTDSTIKNGKAMELNEEKVSSITCGDCGKTNGNLKVGTHWICEDCKASKSYS